MQTTLLGLAITFIMTLMAALIGPYCRLESVPTTIALNACVQFSGVDGAALRYRSLAMPAGPSTPTPVAIPQPAKPMQKMPDTNPASSVQSNVLAPRPGSRGVPLKPRVFVQRMPLVPHPPLQHRN